MPLLPEAWNRRVTQVNGTSMHVAASTQTAFSFSFHNVRLFQGGEASPVTLTQIDHICLLPRSPVHLHNANRTRALSRDREPTMAITPRGILPSPTNQRVFNAH